MFPKKKPAGNILNALVLAVTEGSLNLDLIPLEIHFLHTEFLGFSTLAKYPMAFLFAINAITGDV
jgi:hypothetical protein